MLAKWPIRNKLLIGISLLLVIVTILSYSGFHGLYAYRSLVRGLSRRVYELPLANEFSQRVSDLRVTLSETRGLRDMQSAGLSSPLGARLAREEFRIHLQNARNPLARYKEMLVSSDDDSFSISDNRREWQTVGEIEKTLARIDDVNHDEDWLFDKLKFGQLTGEVEHLQRLAADLPSFLHDNIREFTADARSQYRTLIFLTWCTSVTTVVMFILFIHLVYRWILRPLRVLVKGSRKVAAGNFHYRIALDTRDEMAELAEALNAMTSRFQDIRDDLDRQVQERTKQVVRNEQLASVGFLAAGVAHEINNPLASIALSAESLESRLRDMLDGSQSAPDADECAVIGKYLRMIQSEAFRCKGITEKLLDFSRMGEVKRAPTDLRELVEGVIEMIGHLGKYQDKKVEFSYGPSVTAAVNSQEIKQVVLNLLTNALDSLDPGGKVAVALSARHGQAELIFTDNGCGMTPEVLEHLFEPFFTRRRNGQGTGLGLSITYRIVADHDGSILVHSDGPGMGSQFQVRLPLAAPRTSESEHPSHKETAHRYQAA